MKTAVEELFTEESKATGVTYKVIYTPPAMCPWQPCELMWAYVKHYVADLFQEGRSVEQTIRQVHKAFVGDPEVSTDHGCTVQRCQAWINHCIAEMTSFMSKEASAYFGVQASMASMIADVQRRYQRRLPLQFIIGGDSDSDDDSSDPDEDDD